MKTEIINEVIYRVGRNAKENWDLYDLSEPDDILFHFKDNSSPYVMIEVRDDLPLSYDALKEGAILCKRYSKYKDKDKRQKIIYCEVKYIKKGRMIGEIIIDEKYVKEISV